MSFISSVRAFDQAVPGSFQTNVPLIVGMQGLYGVRTAWKTVSTWSNAITYSDAEIAVNSGFLKQKAAGWVVYAVLDNVLTRGIARVCLVTSRLIYCKEKKDALISACDNWMKYVYHADFHHSVKIIDPAAVHPLWQTLFSAATLCWIQVHYQRVALFVEKLAFFTFQIIKEAFLVCMAYMDAYEALSLSREVGDEALKEMFVNLFYIKDKVIENEEDILSYIQEHEKEVEQVASLCGITYSKAGESFVSHSISALKKVDATIATLDKKVTKTTLNFAQKAVHRLADNLDLKLSDIGCGALIPKDPAHKAASMYNSWMIDACA